MTRPPEKPANGGNALEQSRTYKLKVPVQFGEGELVTEITIRRPKGREMRNLAGSPEGYTVGTFLDLASDLSEQPPPFFDELDVADVLPIVEVVAGFIGSGPPTGAKRSRR